MDGNTFIGRTILLLRRLLPLSEQKVVEVDVPLLRKGWKEFVGKAVNGVDGESLGSVVDLMADLAGSRIAYTVVELDCPDNHPGSYSVLPWGILIRSPVNDHVFASSSMNRLCRAPSFLSHQWPAMIDSEWCSLVYRRGGKKPYWYGRAPRRPPVVLRVDKLVGMTVRNTLGVELGEVAELVIETPGGRIVYVVLSSEDWPRIQRKLSAIRSERLHLDQEEQYLLLDISLAALRASPGFDSNSWPDRAD